MKPTFSRLSTSAPFNQAVLGLWVLGLSQCTMVPRPDRDARSNDDGSASDAGMDGGDVGPSCAANQLACSGRCVDRLTDQENCGQCGVRCAAANATTACRAGSCAVIACAPGFGDCDSNASTGCETPLNTAANCGGCARRCPVDLTCDATERMCVPVCPNPMLLCGGSCVNPSSDAANCGRCGQRCEFANATAVCAGGTCDWSMCRADYGDCDGDRTNGCEASLTSVANCGRCGMQCAFANATAQCAMASCRIGSCNSGFADCDGNPANGCELPVSADASNCGACRNQCAPGASCVRGRCESMTVPPAVIPNSAACTAGGSAAGNKAVMDENGVLYLAMICGSTISVSVSRNTGFSWSAPTPSPLMLRPGDGEYAMSARTGGGFALVSVQSNAEVNFTESTDGVGYMAPVVIGRSAQAPSPSGWSVTILQRANTTLVAYPSNPPQRVTILRRLGGGAWASQSLGPMTANPELMLDPAGNAIWLGLESGAPFRSDDDGVTFNSPGRGPARQTHADFAIANGTMYVVGSTSNLDFIPLAAIGPMQPAVQSIALTNVASPLGGRSVVADSGGNLYVATGLMGPGHIQRIPMGAMVADAARPIAPMANQIAIHALANARGVFGSFSSGPGAGVSAFVLTY